MTATNHQAGGVRNGSCEGAFLCGIICADVTGCGMRWVHAEAISRTYKRLSAPFTMPLRRTIGWDA